MRQFIGYGRGKKANMNFYSSWFSPGLMWAANLALLLLLLPLATAAWRSISRHHAATAAALLILALWWSLRAQIGGGQIGGMSYHLLGLALITLMLGSAAALWLGSLMMLAATALFNGAVHLPVAGLNVWCSVVPPVLVSQALLYGCRRFLPPNLFVYIFINGFLAAAIGMLLAGLCITGALAWSAAFNNEALWHNALPVFLFIAWGEAFLSGLLCAVFVALAPQLMSTFSDERYLRRQNTIW